MQFHQYDKNNMMYAHSAIAQPDPLEPGNYMMPPNATLMTPPPHNDDEYVIWAGDKWKVKQRRAGSYWHKQTIETLEVTDPFDGDLSDYTKIQPPVHESGDTLEFQGGVWVLTLCDKSIESLRLLKLAKVKAVVNRKIRTIKGEELPTEIWLQKSQNYQDTKQAFVTELLSEQPVTDKRVSKEQYDHAVERINRKNRYVDYYREIIKPRINAMTVSQLQAFDAEGSELWSNFDGE